MRKVLFAPTHPNGDGSMADINREQNADLLRRLLECPFELTVRYIGTLEQNALWEADGVTYVNGGLTAQTAEIDVTDVVVAAEGTFPTLGARPRRPDGHIRAAGRRQHRPARASSSLRSAAATATRTTSDTRSRPTTARSRRSSERPPQRGAGRALEAPLGRQAVQPAAFVALIERIALAGPDPVRIDPTKRFTTLAFADEVLERPELLAQYTASVGPHDDASLVLWTPGAGPELLLEMAQSAIDASGVDPDTLPDILVAPMAGSPAAERALAERADAVLGDWPRFGPLAALPSFAEAFVT